VQSICDYISNPNGTVTIHDNKDGCNNPTEVETACELVFIEKINFDNKPIFFPNPAKDKITITFNNNVIVNDINIYNTIGKKIKIDIRNNTIDISNLNQGLYIIEVTTNKWKLRNKLIIE
jgi:hypothetical protein